MQAHVSTESRSVSTGMYESLLHGNREMHRLHRQYETESAEIVDRFGNHEPALRTAEGELVGITPATAAVLIIWHTADADTAISGAVSE